MTVELYHAPNAICAQKVRVCLAEKGVSFVARDMEGKLRDPMYLKINPNGYVPTLLHNGQLIWESRVISEYINGAFSGPSLLPEAPIDKARVALWTKQIDDTLHLNIFTLSFVVVFRDSLLHRSEDDQRRYLALDVTKRERTLDLIQYGWDSHYVKVAVERFIELIDEMEVALAGKQWLVGDSYSLADCDLTPYLSRLSDLGLSRLWREKPNVSAWFDRVRSRSSFDEVISKWVPADQLLRFAEGRQAAEPKFEYILCEAPR